MKAQPTTSRIVDAHVHLWDVDAVSIPWFHEGLGLPRHASALDLDLALAAADVVAAVAVQAADSVDEARWLMDTVRDRPRERRAVLQYSPSTALPASLASPPEIAGFRAAVPQCASDLSDVDGLDALADRLGADGRVLEFLVRPDQLPAVAALSRRHPRTPVVVCHLGLGAARPDDRWHDALREAAAAPGVFAKVSGLALTGRDAADGRSIVAAASRVFGTERLMFGSDWPMSTRTATYDDVLGATLSALPTPLDAEPFWAGTAAHLYGL